MKKNSFLKGISIIKMLIVLLFIIIIVLFVSSELKKSSIQIVSILKQVDWTILIVAITVYCMYFFFSSYGLRYLLTRKTNDLRLSIPICFGLLNISGLTKYIPGKVWAYTIMFDALKRRGLLTSKIVFDNLVHLILTISTSFMLMIPVTIFMLLPNISLFFQMILVITGVVLYTACIIASPFLLKVVVAIINRIKKKDPIDYIPVSRIDILMVQTIIIVSYILYVVSISLIVFSISRNLDFIEYIEIAIICVFSGTIGFLAIIIPGGIGVQETLIYYFMGTRYSDTYFLVILPILVRLVSILTDLVVGLLSLWLIRKEVSAIIMKKQNKQ